MTNWEYYNNEIKEMVGNASLIAVVDDKPVVCQDIDCLDCDYHGHKDGCQAQLKEWLNAEHCEFKKGELVEVMVHPMSSCWELRKFSREEQGTYYVYCDYAYEDDECVFSIHKYGTFGKFLQEKEVEKEDE